MNQRIKMVMMQLIALLSGIRASCDLPTNSRCQETGTLISYVQIENCDAACYDHCKNITHLLSSPQYCCSYRLGQNCRVFQGGLGAGNQIDMWSRLITQNGTFCSDGVNPDPDSDLASKPPVSTQTYCVLSTDTITFGSIFMFFQKTTQNPNNIGNCEQTSSETGVTIDSSTGLITITDVTPRTLVFNFKCDDLDDCRADSASNSVTFEIGNADILQNTEFSAMTTTMSPNYVGGTPVPQFDFSSEKTASQQSIDTCGITFSLWSSASDSSPPAKFSLSGSGEQIELEQDTAPGSYSFWLSTSATLTSGNSDQRSKGPFTMDVLSYEFCNSDCGEHGEQLWADKFYTLDECYTKCRNALSLAGAFGQLNCCEYRTQTQHCAFALNHNGIYDETYEATSRYLVVTQSGGYCSDLDDREDEPGFQLDYKFCSASASYPFDIKFGSATTHFFKTKGDTTNIGNCQLTAENTDTGVTISSEGEIQVTDKSARSFTVYFQCQDLDHPFPNAGDAVDDSEVNVEVKQFDVFSHSSFQSSNLNPQRVYKIDGNPPFIDFATQVNQILADVNDCGVTFDLQTSDTNQNNPGHFEPMTDFLTTKRVERASGSESVPGVFTFHLSATFPSSEKQVSQQFTLIVTNCDLQLDGAEPDIFLNEPFQSMSMEQTFSINDSEQPYFDFTAQFDGLQSIIAYCGIAIWRITSDTDSNFPSFMDYSQSLGSTKKAYLKTLEPLGTYKFWLKGSYLPVGASSNSVFYKGPFKLKTVRWCQKACSHSGPTIVLGSGWTQSQCYEQCELNVIDPSKINCCGFNLNGGHCGMVRDDYNGVPQFESGSSRTTVTSGGNYCSDIQPAYQKYENSGIYQSEISFYNTTIGDCLDRCNSDLNCQAVVHRMSDNFC